MASPATPEPVPFKINVSDELLSFINERVVTARIPPGLKLPEEDAWAYGVPPQTMSRLQSYWTTQYDWRATEARINAHLKMFTLPIQHGGEELAMHFVWHQSEREGAIPLLFQHGWPGNFLEVDRIIDDLVAPTDPAQQAYHVVAPSLPGFVFSSRSQRPEFALGDMAAVNHKLMLALGYDTYMAQGGDWGSMIVRIMGTFYPESCVAVHVNMIAARPPSIWRHPLQLLYLIAWAPLQGKDSTFTRMMWWLKEESGYLEIQGTKPQTLSYALVDSPMGMLAWIRDKVQHLVGDDFVLEDEEIITWAMLYLIPGTAGHAEIYKNAKEKKKMESLQKDSLGKTLSREVDFGASIFPKGSPNSLPPFFSVPSLWH